MRFGPPACKGGPTTRTAVPTRVRRWWSIGNSSRKIGGRDAAVDAVQQHPADPVEVAEQRPAAGAKLPQQGFRAGVPLVALLDQFPIDPRQFCQAELQRL